MIVVEELVLEPECMSDKDPDSDPRQWFPGGDHGERHLSFRDRQ